MGSADPELQLKLFATYAKLLLENGTLPGAICFYTDGVRLVCEGSPVLDQLREFESQGVDVISCRTCVEYFNLKEKVRVGTVGGMPAIMEAMARADKVVSV